MRWRSGGLLCAALPALLLVAGCAANRSRQPTGAMGPSESPEEIIVAGDSLRRHWGADHGGARALWFQVRSPRNVGVFAEMDASRPEATADTLLAHYFSARRSWLGEGGIPLGELPLAMGISTAWYPWALIALPDTAIGTLRLTWISHDAPDPQLQGRALLPKRPPAILRAEQRLADPLALDETPASRAPVTLQQELQARVLGSATVDLSTGRVIRRTGSVR